MSKRIHRNMWNHPWLGWPLTGPDAIAHRFPVAGYLETKDGTRLLIAEGESCHALAARDMEFHPANVIRPKGAVIHADTD